MQSKLWRKSWRSKLKEIIPCHASSTRRYETILEIKLSEQEAILKATTASVKQLKKVSASEARTRPVQKNTEKFMRKCGEETIVEGRSVRVLLKFVAIRMFLTARTKSMATRRIRLQEILEKNYFSKQLQRNWKRYCEKYFEIITSIDGRERAASLDRFSILGANIYEQSSTAESTVLVKL